MHRFVLYACIGLMLGIAIRSQGDYGWSFVMLGLLFTVCILTIWYTSVRHDTHILYASVLVVCVTVGFARMDLAVPQMEAHPATGEVVTFTGDVVREPDIRGTHTNIVIRSDDSTHHILVRISPHTGVSYGDTVSFSGVLEPVENFASETERVFNYRGYLAKDDIYHIVAFPEAFTITDHHRATLTGSLLGIKHAYLGSLQRLLPEPAASLAGGITVGERRSLGEVLTQQFRDVGLIHIVVLSGYNIAIITLFIVAILSFLPQRIRYAVAILGIILFTILVGASATVVRAAIMGCIGALGAMLGRSYDALHTLLLAAIGMLLWNPYVLVYDPSFQLSFMATLGLLVGLPIVTPYLWYIPEQLGLRDIIGATISTHIAVLPLLTHMVGSVSVVALIVNVLVLPMIPLAMLAVFLSGVLGLLHYAVAFPFVAIAHALLSYIIGITRFFGELPFAAVQIPLFSGVWVITAYAALACAVVYIKGKGGRYYEGIVDR